MPTNPFVLRIPLTVALHATCRRECRPTHRFDLSVTIPRALRHAADKPTCFLVLDERQTNADMVAALSRAGEVLGDFVEMYIAMIHFEQELDRALQPDMKASHAGRFDHDTVVEIA